MLLRVVALAVVQHAESLQRADARRRAALRAAVPPHRLQSLPAGPALAVAATCGASRAPLLQASKPPTHCIATTYAVVLFPQRVVNLLLIEDGHRGLAERREGATVLVKCQYGGADSLLLSSQSTLFNALVENGKAAAANFPFCTSARLRHE